MELGIRTSAWQGGLLRTNGTIFGDCEGRFGEFPVPVGAIAGFVDPSP